MSVSRRTFLGAVPAALAAQSVPTLNRRDIVSRHNPTLRGIDPRSPLSVGNGEFAFTADPTGLQTFPQPYETQMPLCTQSQWGWHTAPNVTDKGPADLRLTEFDTFGRKVGYPTSTTARSSSSIGSAKIRTASTSAASPSPSKSPKRSVSSNRLSTSGPVLCTASSNGAGQKSRWRPAATRCATCSPSP